LQNLYCKVTLNWHYRETIWPHVPYGSGTADVTISQSGGQVGISAGESTGHPVLRVDSCSISLNKLDITIHGSILSWLYDLIIDLFKGSIKSAIQNAIKDQLTNGIQIQLNQMIAAYSFHIKVDDNTLMNWELTSAPRFPGDGSILVPLNGGFEVINPQKVCPLPHSALQTQRSGRMVDIVLDQFMPDSAFWSFFEQGKLQRLIRPTDISPQSPIQLNTSSFAIAFPTLYLLYPNRLMQLLLYSTSAPTIGLAPAPKDTSLGALTNIIVYVDTTGGGAFKPVFTLSAALEMDVEANITQQTLCMNFDKLTFVLGLVNSTIGPFDVTILDVLIDIALKTVVLPEANKIANRGVPLPSFDGLSFVNAFVAFASGYVNIATDLQYKPPSLTMPPPTEWDLEVQSGRYPTSQAIDLNA